MLFHTIPTDLFDGIYNLVWNPKLRIIWLSTYKNEEALCLQTAAVIAWAEPHFQIADSDSPLFVRP